MRRAVAFMVGVLLFAAILAADPLDAVAKPCAKAKFTGNCVVKATKKQVTERSSSASGRNGRSGPSAEQVTMKRIAAYERASKSYYDQVGKYEQCLLGSTAACVAPAPRSMLLGAIAFEDGRPAGSTPLMTPGQAGAIAVARLQLPLNPPKVGPDPKVNKWKMAAVGYPLWVWADGPTHVGPVSDSVAGLSVSLDAQLTKTVFKMGDGQTVTCRDGGTPYTKGTKAATPSPDCGYRYEKPSLPKGDYTVTAIGYWAVTWTVNGTSGVITVPRAASAPLPVGEVQVLVR